MVRKIVTENRTSLHNDTVCALLSCKLNCDDRSAAGFKPSKVELNAAKKATYKCNLVRPASRASERKFSRGYEGR